MPQDEPFSSKVSIMFRRIGNTTQEATLRKVEFKVLDPEGIGSEGQTINGYIRSFLLQDLERASPQTVTNYFFMMLYSVFWPVKDNFESSFTRAQHIKFSKIVIPHNDTWRKIQEEMKAGSELNIANLGSGTIYAVVTFMMCLMGKSVTETFFPEYVKKRLGRLKTMFSVPTEVSLKLEQVLTYTKLSHFRATLDCDPAMCHSLITLCLKHEKFNHERIQMCAKATLQVTAWNKLTSIKIIYDYLYANKSLAFFQRVLLPQASSFVKCLAELSKSGVYAPYEGFCQHPVTLRANGVDPTLFPDLYAVAKGLGERSESTLTNLITPHVSMNPNIINRLIQFASVTVGKQDDQLALDTLAQTAGETFVDQNIKRAELEYEQYIKDHPSETNLVKNDRISLDAPDREDARKFNFGSKQAL